MNRLAGLSPVMKWSLGVLCAIVLGLAALAVFGSSPAKTPAPVPSGHANIVLMHSRGNVCTEDVGEARIYVTLTLRNTGDAAGKVNPWAAFDYSDGGDSTESYVTNWGHSFTVPAHSVREANFYHTYNPQQHAVLRCTGYPDLGSDTGGYALPVG